MPDSAIEREPLDIDLDYINISGEFLSFFLYKLTLKLFIRENKSERYALMCLVGFEPGFLAKAKRLSIDPWKMKSGIKP